ncbi:hypothetical protein Adt_32707 [Abeliophyllum distichum]|uniref:Uncharacterized protein n=1 Tax=Abeliophyllum distichum TaxID=126358 RepID=A0ABD1QWY1_9LAMI
MLFQFATCPRPRLESITPQQPHHNYQPISLLRCVWRFNCFVRQIEPISARQAVFLSLYPAHNSHVRFFLTLHHDLCALNHDCKPYSHAAFESIYPFNRAIATVLRFQNSNPAPIAAVLPISECLHAISVLGFQNILTAAQ